MENNDLIIEKKKLTKGQKKYYEAINWLLNPLGPRGSGRTHLMALSFIEHSLYHKMWIEIYDHSTNPYSKNEVFERIRDIISGTKNKLHLKIKKGGQSISIKVEERVNYDKKKRSL